MYFCVEGAPSAYDGIVGKLPGGVTRVARLKPPLDMVHVFASEAAGLAGKLRGYRAAIVPDGMIWASWPKKSSGGAFVAPAPGLEELARDLLEKICQSP